ncbi:TIGR00341 family protein [Halorarius litoreus]|uniref:TIGR00341 family protein n=1 Tax=Halorarius litoreus TaxID=2962676 RepID=UPI0020CEF268|nr:TIGR00341 family protein [Halorarius litoreus]
MRLIRVLVGDDSVATVSEVLDDEGIDFVTTEERDRDAVVIEFPLPVQAVDSVLDRLREEGFDDGSYTVIANAESATTERFDELEARYVEGTEETDSVAHEEVRSKARSLLPDRRTYYAMTVLSVLVATAGLLLDSPAVVIGSMAIAPQVGATITASVGTVVGDRRMAIDGTRSLALGLLVAVVGAVVFGWILRSTGFFPPALDVTTVEQISSRISPGLLSLLLGLCAGSAAAFGVATDLPLSLVGVAIAAAVVPAAAAVGIGVVWGLPLVAFGAAVLLLINAVSILLAGTVTLWYLGYRPEGWTPGALRANLTTGEASVGLATVVLLLVVASGPTVAMVEHVSLENAANGAVQDTLERPEYRRLSLVSVRTGFTDLGLLGIQQEVTVRVRRPVDESYPSLAADIAAQVEEASGQPVSISIEFVEQQEYEP